MAPIHPHKNGAWKSRLGAAVALAVFAVGVIDRYNKRKVIQIPHPAAPETMGAARASRTDKSPIHALEFPYGFKGRHAITFMALFTLLPAFVFLLDSTSGRSPAGLIDLVLSVRYGSFVLLVPLAWFAIPIAWFRTRGQVLRLTASELQIGNITVPLDEVQSVRIIKSGWTRSMVVQAGKRKAGINQMMLPNPQAFDEVVRALTSGRSLNNPVPSAAKERVFHMGPTNSSAGMPQHVAPGSVEPVGGTPECEAIRQQLRLALMYDEAKIDRLVAIERGRQPSATDTQLHAAAYERWCRDNRI